MSKIHILESNNGWSYKVAIHFAVPTGNNSVGFSWKACGLESGMTGTTSLEVGTGPSNLTQAEYDNILAGDIIEITKNISPGLSPTNATVEALCDIAIDEWKQDVSRILKYFGHKIEGT